jgi:hypothetical protein
MMAIASPLDTGTKPSAAAIGEMIRTITPASAVSEVAISAG